MEIETQQDIRSVPAENLAPQSGASTLDATAHCRRTMLKFGLGALVAGAYGLPHEGRAQSTTIPEQVSGLVTSEGTVVRLVP